MKIEDGSMDINIEIKESKIIISWADVKADYYKIFFKKEDIFYEAARVYDNTSVRFSLVSYGENECFVQAVRDGQVIDESSKRQFKFDTIDVQYRFEDDKNIKLFYSKYEGADGYRLYRNEDEIGFNGFKNSDTEYITTELRAETEFKVKPFKKDDDCGRKFLASSFVVKTNENRFESVSIYKSYNYNNFLSWCFTGDADGFLVYTQNLDKPIFER